MHIRTLTALFLVVSLTPAAELPVRTVVLYKHGIGFFERGGTLNAGESVRLEFKADDMNDVLKSLTINEGGGSAVKGLRYDSSIPLEEKLKEFPFQLEDGKPLVVLLDQLKGSRLEVELGSQKIAGAIVSGRTIAGDKDHQEKQQITLLLDTGDIRIIDLAAATSVRFTDAKLQLQFRDLLAALTGARSLDKRSLYIDSTDSKAREVRATYITRMPAWKSSYRLLLDAALNQSQLEGWAIVDNTTGEDWTNIKISLVSGRPISFISQLYEPKYIARKEADLPENEAVAPKLYGGVIGGLASAPPPPAPMAMAKRSAMAVDKADAQMQRAEQFAALQRAPGVVMSNLAATAASGELADLFEYSIRNAVTVKKNESAMLPFLQEKITARKLIIYSDNSRPNPLNAAEIINGTGKTLDGGPITVYDGGAYAGEALVETIKANDKRLISYGVDLGTRITVKPGSSTSNERQITAHRGVVTTKSALVEKTVYTIKNVDAKAKTLLIERPIRPNYHVLDAKPVETTAEVNRFEVKLAAGALVEFTVTEENVYDSSTTISSYTPDRLNVLLQNKVLSENAKRQLQGILTVKNKIAALDAESKRLESEVASSTREEERLRQNIASLSNVSGQQQIVQQYASKLSASETLIGSKTDRIAQIGTERAALQTDLDNRIAALEF